MNLLSASSACATLTLRRFLGLSGLLAGVLLCAPAKGASGAAVPWIRYEAENMSFSGGILGPYYTNQVPGIEASGRKYAQLSVTGNYVQFTNQSAANAMVVRYCVPDSADGAGTDYTLSVYTNGVYLGKLLVTSKYSWLYGIYPFTNYPPAGSARNYYDEARTNGLSLSAGDIVRLEKDATDTASLYIVDLVEMESVAPLVQPGNSRSIMNDSAHGDGVHDDTSGLINCISNAVKQGQSVWLPAGTYKITGSINLPSNTTIQGAGMWYATLVGDPTVYGNSSRRVALNGNGSNIHLSDFAIIGKLNYRNDNEPNDGLVGSYGTGSTISRIWVEHTKTGAWIVNSQGLVVDSCRFRDTIADGINLCVGMQNTLVTNCTARGTGDDCFPIWPASYNTPAYTPGNNVITHCTAQCPFLANGGAIYGGASNRIEDCLFQDIPYGCGILLSTHFQVSATFSGTTVAQRCDLNRCGGQDPGYGWRAALQLCMDAYNGISGVNLNNLNITNSVSDGLSVIGNSGPLSGAMTANISIPNYGIGPGGRNALWARSDTSGSMTVSNCTIPQYRNDSANFAFNFVTSTIPVTVQTTPAGRLFTVDGAGYSSSQAFDWTPGSAHTLATTSPQSGGTGTQYVWTAWSDAGALSHLVTPSTGSTYTASFNTQYYLIVNAGPGGNAYPGNLWTNAGATVNISATASNGYTFGAWTGLGDGSYSGSASAASLTLSAAITETAGFAVVTNAYPPSQAISGIAINPDSSLTICYATTPGFSYHIETATNLTPAVWSLIPGSETNATGDSVSFTDPTLAGSGPVYYRIGSP
ncbi:MAG TPA: glycosyl hydrolase family 28-related protein [Candidatus Acidoferrum sp.]|nr:glycosyl hydrolase family 28-related protein [Candidatus Acidoferrum sp.]